MIPLSSKLCHLTTLPIDLHIQIFSNLQPYDILKASQTCKVLYFTSLERAVWLDALHRICVENTLFEPSFPVASMSVGELQHAAMGPHHWISRSSSKERNSDGLLPHLAKRRLMLPTMDIKVVEHLESLVSPYLVPGGRYLFSFSEDLMVLWDLGSPYSSKKEPCIIATRSIIFDRLYLVHSTSDGLGLRIFIPDGTVLFNIYEIYPESTSPEIIQIANTCIPHLFSFFDMRVYSLSYDRLIFLYETDIHGHVATVWNYKTNTWARWGFEGDYHQILVSKSTLTLVRPHGASVWQIPPLLPESSLSMNTKPSLVSPAFELVYPEGQAHTRFFQAPCDWYSGTSQPLYYDLTHTPFADPLKISRFEVTISSNISGADLHLRNDFEEPLVDLHHLFQATRICQDKNITIYIDAKGCLGSRMSDIYDQQLASFSTPLCYPRLGNHANVTMCPVVGRLVFYEFEESSMSSITILDF